MKKVYKIIYEAFYGIGDEEIMTIAYVYDTLESVTQFVHDLNEEKHSNFGEETDEYYYYAFIEVKFSTLNHLREIYFNK